MTTFRRAMYVLLVLLAAAATGCRAGPAQAPTPQLPTPVPSTVEPTPILPTATMPPVLPSASPTIAQIPPAATPSPARSATAASGPAASPVERQLVVAALDNQAKATSYGMKIRPEGKSSLIPFPGDIVMEISQTSVRSVYMKLGDVVEMIISGQDAYVRLGQGWLKMPVQQAQLQQIQGGLDLTKSLTAEELDKAAITRVGVEQVDGVSAQVFDVIPPSAPLQAEPSITGKPFRIWIDQATRLVIKEVLKEREAVITITFYGWNTIKVEPPKN
jgi:hypothetical protein